MIHLSRPSITDAEKQAVLQALDSGQLAMGPRVAAFEAALARWCGAPHAVATASGTSALHLALLAHGIGPGDEVVTTPFTFVATVNAILYTGARPVFADVERRSGNLDPAEVARVITPRTRAVLAVHLYGRPAPLDALATIADANRLVLIEDAAQALGAEHRARRIGSISTTCFSFYATKNATTGEGGMVLTHDAVVAARVRALRRQGVPPGRRQEHQCLGYNYRMSELHAALGGAQVARLDELLARRRSNARLYLDALASVPGSSTHLAPPEEAPGERHAHNQFVVRVTGGRRDQAAEVLGSLGIETGVYYRRPVTELEHVRPFVTGTPANALHLADEVLAVPVHPALSERERDEVAGALVTLAGKLAA